jgi:hypothetical protein
MQKPRPNGILRTTYSKHRTTPKPPLSFCAILFGKYGTARLAHTRISAVFASKTQPRIPYDSQEKPSNPIKRNLCDGKLDKNNYISSSNPHGGKTYHTNGRCSLSDFSALKVVTLRNSHD